jgi:hypothetical protein
MTNRAKVYAKIALMWIVSLTLAIAASAWLSTANAKTIQEDAGGSVRDYVIAVSLATLRGDQVRIAGRCASACTMYLATACVTPRAVLQFHAARDEATGKIDHAVTRDLAAYYPAPLRKWFMANAAHLSGSQYAELTGAQAIALGAMGC